MEDTAMKKYYINPEMNVVKIATMQMLAASNEQPLQTGEATEWGSRSFDFDDDEEEW
jgi:hypothetical protein